MNALEELEIEQSNREDWRTAMIVCTVINLVREKGSKAIQPGDVMPWLLRPIEPKKTRRQTALEQRVILEHITLAMGGTVKPLTPEQLASLEELEKN